MHVACVGWCGGLYVGWWGPLKSVKGRVRRWHALSEVPDRSPWKSPPSIMMWSGLMLVSVLRDIHVAACSARSCGR